MTGTVDIDAVQRNLDENRERYVAELQELLRIPSVSADSAFREDCLRAAAFAHQQLESCGLSTETVVTDGLPTQGTSPPRGNKVSSSDRVRLYRKALAQLPRNVPINVILAPMEGDPMAASEFWQLAQVSKGSFLSPSKDWP